MRGCTNGATAPCPTHIRQSILRLTVLYESGKGRWRHSCIREYASCPPPRLSEEGLYLRLIDFCITHFIKIMRLHLKVMRLTKPHTLAGPLEWTSYTVLRTLT